MSNAAKHVPNMIPLNGQDYELRPLNWKQLKANREDIIIVSGMKAQQTMFTPEQQDAILHVVTASLQRARPDIKEDFVAEYMDLGNVGAMLKAVFGQPMDDGDAGKGEAGAASSAS